MFTSFHQQHYGAISKTMEPCWGLLPRECVRVGGPNLILDNLILSVIIPIKNPRILWQWWNQCLSMIRSGLIAPGVFHLDRIITLWDGRRPIWRQWQPLRTVWWWFRSSMEVGDTDHIRWHCQFFQVFSRMDFEPWKTVTVTRWRASSLTHIVQSNKAQPDLFHLPCGPSPFWLL